MGSGRFVVFEGLDGSGKTTQMRRLAERLAADGIHVHTTCEPTNGPIGAILRQYLEHRVILDPRVLPYLYAADRSDHLYNPTNGIERALSEGVTVLCDRFVLSSFAYQVPEHSSDLIDYLNRSFRKPDLTIFLRTDPSTGLFAKRKQSSFALDANETLERLTSAAIQYERAIHEFGRVHNVAAVEFADLDTVSNFVYAEWEKLSHAA